MAVVRTKRGKRWSKPLGGAKGGSFLLRFADQHDAFLTCHLFNVGRHHIIFALSLLKRQHGHLMQLGIALDRATKAQLIGAIAIEDSTGYFRSCLKNQLAPPSNCSFGM
jgi:hypothetical protein